MRISKFEYGKYGFSELSWNVAVRASFKCEYCGFNLIDNVYSYELWQIDHILPKSKGGLDEFDNLALACKFCNRMKRNKIFNGQSRRDILENIKRHIATNAKDQINKLNSVKLLVENI